MTKIGILPLAEEGHVFATFGLATKLQKYGYEIVYLGIADLKNLVESRGFKFVTILENEFPKNFKKEEIPKIYKYKFRFQKLQAWASIFKKNFDFCLDQKTDIFLQKLSLDLIIVDILSPEFAILSSRNNINTVIFSSLMPYHKSQFVAPATQFFVPDKSLQKQISISFRWGLLYFLANLKSLLSLFVTGFSFRSSLKILASVSGFKLDKIDFNTTYGAKLDIPHLFLCPEEFDFPRTKEKNLYYVESLVIPENIENKSISEKIYNQEKIVFCTLGSQGFQFKSHKQFFDTLIDIFSAKPDWHLVISLGSLDNYLKIEDYRQYENISVYNWVCQLEILQSCSYMITHGGLGTVKECLYYGVPMICLPIQRDQFSNAARVIYHGVGLSTKMRNINKKKLINLISEMENNNTFKINSFKMSKIFKQKENQNISTELIQRFIQEKINNF